MPEIYAETITTTEGVVFEPVSADGAIGYKATAPDGRVEYVLLNPSAEHQASPDAPDLADTFLYWVGPKGARAWEEENAGPGTGVALVDLGSPITYINHFDERDDDA